MDYEQEQQVPPLVPYMPGAVPVPHRDQQKPLMKMINRMMPKPKGKMPHTPRGRKTGQNVKIGHHKNKTVWY